MRSRSHAMARRGWWVPRALRWTVAALVVALAPIGAIPAHAAALDGVTLVAPGRAEASSSALAARSERVSPGRAAATAPRRSARTPRGSVRAPRALPRPAREPLYLRDCAFLC